MNENTHSNLPTKYRQTWEEIAKLQVRQSKVKALEDEISIERYNSLLEEYAEELKLLKPQLVDLEAKIHSDISSFKEKINNIESDVLNISTKLKDIDTLIQNDIIDDMQHQKEKKILEMEKTKFENSLDSYREEVAEIELLLKYPNPEDKAKAIADKEAKEKDERLAKDKFEKEIKELEEKRKLDFQYQLDQKVQSIKRKSEIDISRLNKEIFKYKENINGIKTVNKLLKIKIDELEEGVEIAYKKAEKYKDKIRDLHEKLEKKSTPCPDVECEGHIGFEGICSHCAKDYKTAKTDWVKRRKLIEIRHNKKKSNRRFKILFFIQSLFIIWVVIVNSGNSQYHSFYTIHGIIVILFISTILVWWLKYSGYNTAIRDIEDYGLGNDYIEAYDKEKYMKEMEDLKKKIETLKKDK